MKRVPLNLRWGKVIAWVLLVIAAAGAVAGYLFGLPRWESARGAGPTVAEGSRSIRATYSHRASGIRESSSAR